MNPNEALRNAILKHRVLVSQYMTGVIVDWVALFRDVDIEIRNLLRESGDISRMTMIELNALIDDIKRFNLEADFELRHRAEQDFADLVTAEIAFAVALLAPYGKIHDVSVAHVLEMAKNTPIDGLLPSENLASVKALRDKVATQTLRRAYIEGNTAQDVIADLYGSASNGHTGAMTRTTTRAVDVMGRLALGGHESVAREAVYKENENLVHSVQWVAVLDGNTCIVCGELDGQVWRLDEPHPEAPYHGGCRCALVPVLIGERVPEKWTFEDWLANQDAETQKEVLGTSRYSLYKQGTPFKSFVVDGRIKTLQELGVRK